MRTPSGSWPRGAQVQPVLDTFHGWLQAKRDQVLPGSALGKAVAFALSEWPKLIRYLDHPYLTPDNNACEQAIRPFVVGPKELAVFGKPTRSRGERDPVQPDRDRQGQPARAVLVSARAVREAAPRAHPRRLPLAPADCASAAAGFIEPGFAGRLRSANMPG